MHGAFYKDVQTKLKANPHWCLPESQVYKRSKKYKAVKWKDAIDLFVIKTYFYNQLNLIHCILFTKPQTGSLITF